MKRPYLRELVLLCVLALLVVPLAARAAGDAGAYWWRDVPSREGLDDALRRYDTSVAQLEANPQAALQRSADWSDPLRWISHTLHIYRNAASGTYEIPVIELRNRLTRNSRADDFATWVAAVPGQSIAIRPVTAIPSGVRCTVTTATDFDRTDYLVDGMELKGGGEHMYSPATAGTVMLHCVDQDRTHPLAGRYVSFHVQAASTAPTPFFIFGITPFREWSSLYSKRPNALDQVLLFNGRTSFYVPAAKAAAAAERDIGGLLGEHLDIVQLYDALNGVDSGPGSGLHVPTSAMISASYKGCCSAWTVRGLTQIGFKGSPGDHTDWGDWHELGHQHQMLWGWFGELTEVSVNLYSLEACRALRMEPETRQCHSSGLPGLDWDHEAVGTFLQSGVRHEFDAMGAGTEFQRLNMFGQLLTTYDGLFAALGRDFRTANHYGDGEVARYTNAQKKDWFVVNTSRIAGRDLRAFYRQWGLGFSQEADAAVAALNLPAPVLPSCRENVTLVSTGAAASVKGSVREPHPKHVGLLAYQAAQGPTRMVWEDVGYARLSVPVRDQRGVLRTVHLRGQRSAGECGSKPINTTQSCVDGTSSFWTVSFLPGDNPDLPAGRHTGNLHLAARDWKQPEWGGTVRIRLDVTIGG